MILTIHLCGVVLGYRHLELCLRYFFLLVHVLFFVGLGCCHFLDPRQAWWLWGFLIVHLRVWVSQRNGHRLGGRLKWMDCGKYLREQGLYKGLISPGNRGGVGGEAPAIRVL